MKLVHKSLTACGLTICALLIAFSPATQAQNSAPAEYLPYYNPATGFKPAQTSLTQVFLQVAGSLEHHGSPEPYIRHMQAEHKRVSALYEQKTGKPHKGRMPAHMTNEYLGQFLANWNSLSPKLKLDELAREVGRCSREGIRGTRNTGTIAIEVFNEHQDRLMEGMKAGTSPGADFERFRAEVKDRLEFNKPGVTLVGYDTARRDAVSYALILEGRFNKLFAKIDAALPATQAAQIKDAVLGFFIDTARLAQSEFEIGILEFSLKN
ncbi:hypothetical protein SAMN02745166_03496 [Prosthecobacter debontii]|uniref:Uncharacterized protein n=2 Tax=Prosthecobacter debontii TaxID=48467 RepID=A0A1T4YJC5_9BACT|nr:hypothetical protein SAMN02745166_03496 [Prosthecobacter debontii]